jgi:hypothetical protein
MPPQVKNPIRSARRFRVETPASSEEVLDLNVSGSEDDNDSSVAQPAPTNAQPVTPADVGVNNADVRERKNFAPDIRYFYEVTPTAKICKLCR